MFISYVLYHSLVRCQENKSIFDCPVAEYIVKKKLITIPHNYFLGDGDDINDIYRIFEKVITDLNDLKKYKRYSIINRLKLKLL